MSIQAISEQTAKVSHIKRQIQQVHELRELCRLMVEQQEDALRLISDKLDVLEVNLTVAYAEEAGVDEGGATDAQ